LTDFNGLNAGDSMTKAEKPDKKLCFSRFESPLGGITIAEYGGKICVAEFAAGARAKKALAKISAHYGSETIRSKTGTIKKAEKQIKLYFSGKLENFDLPLDFPGSEFQKSVWRQLLKIPFGKTVNYGWIAEKAGSPQAARAAGTAIGSNRISILIPCHRVVGRDGSLTGYGGGLWRKKWLLRQEGAI
jgi:AraC family transcriptional regulator of adaptative response/methylated-DNA-[protein]-cysteine methyltransferase